MSKKPKVTTHYADGRPSETRDMTPEEIAENVPPEPRQPVEVNP